MQPIAKSTAATGNAGVINTDMIKRSSVNLSVLLICTVLWLARDVIDLNQLQYDRQWLWSQPWRLLTCHFVHFTWQHVGFNVAGLLLLSIAFAPEQHPLYDAGFWLIGGITLSIFLYLSAANIPIYRGLSGVLYGYATYVALVGWRSTPVISSLAILFIIGRVISHLLWPPTDTVATLGGDIAVSAHIGGMVFGSLWAALRYSLRRH
jgi:hypothetical protein